MKYLAIALCGLFLLFAGCKASTTPPAAPLIPGALNSFDQTAYESLSAAHAFALSASTNSASLTAAEKSSLNAFITALNAADVIYAAYHAGTATQAQMTSALNSVSTAQASYATSVTGSK